MLRKLAMRSILVLLTLIIIEVSPLPLVQETYAQSFLQSFFGVDKEKFRKKQNRSTKKIPLVKGPTYKNYRPDKLVTVNFSLLTDPITTNGISLKKQSDIKLRTTFEHINADPFQLGIKALPMLKIKALPEVSKALIEHYSKSPRYRWVNEDGVTNQARVMIELLKTSDLIGLMPENYAVQRPYLKPYGSNLKIDDKIPDWPQLMKFEMRLSAAILTYVLDKQRGFINPNKISGYHDFKRKKPQLDNVIVSLYYSADPAKLLSFYDPQGQHFDALKREMAKLLKNHNTKPDITIAKGTFLRPGGKNPQLYNIIASIRAKASQKLKSEFAFELNTYRGESDYTPELVSLIKAFQKENKLATDGVIGSKTIRVLNKSENTSNARINKLRYAMERARWLPSRLALKRVFINQAAYKVAYFENNQVKLEMPIVVGTKSNQTYIFDDQIEKVEFNPYWGVPQSIITNEMLPKLRADPSYLDRLGYEVTYQGRAISSRDIDWRSLQSMRAIGVRQPPGSENALGQLKILFPNSHAIYMHDTPEKELFGRKVRAFSHGCVRLQNPKAMAAAVLGISIDQVDHYIYDNDNKTVFVAKPIPVHVAYFTAWPNSATGKIEYFADIYNRDNALEKAFSKTVNSRVFVSN